jgi:hypothetical protein
MNIFIFRENLEMEQFSADGSKFDTFQRSEMEKLAPVEIETIRRHEIKKSPRFEIDPLTRTEIKKSPRFELDPLTRAEIKQPPRFELDPLTRAEIETNQRTREPDNLRIQDLYTNLDFESTHYENI